MVYRLKPLDLSFDFDDRAYRLGDSVDVAVHLDPHADVDLREVRVELVCEQRYFESENVVVSRSADGRAYYGAAATKETRQRIESYKHSRATALKGRRLTVGRPVDRRISLRVDPIEPRKAQEARALTGDADRSWSFNWTLVVTADVVRGRNPRRQRKVDIAL